MMTPKADCEALMNAVLPFAEQMLDRHGAFHPFGGAMGADGEVAAAGPMRVRSSRKRSTSSAC
jgi:hypothetical protein